MSKDRDGWAGFIVGFLLGGYLLFLAGCWIGERNCGDMRESIVSGVYYYKDRTVRLVDVELTSEDKKPEEEK